MTLYRITALVSFLALFCSHAHAETLEEGFLKHRKDKPRENFLTLTVENDLFGGEGTDRNYTNGVRFSWLDTDFSYPESLQFVDDYLPFFSVNDTTSVFYSFGQNLYTPRDITQSTLNTSDRPYAAFMYVSMGANTVTKNHLDNLEITAGVVGPAALGESTQRFVHNRIDSSPDPKGWDHQLDNEPALMVSWQRMWPALYNTTIGDYDFRTSPYVGSTIGNVYTYANTGIMFQLLPHSHKWQGSPLRVRPAIPGTGYFSVPEDEFSWYVFGGVEGRVIARNIFLDGNTFSDSHSVDKKYSVADANLGFAITYGRAQITYTLNWRSEEYYGQHNPDVFGAVGIGYRF